MLHGMPNGMPTGPHGTVTFLDPRSQPAAAPVPYTAQFRAPSAGDPIRIGLFANGFPDSVAFLGHVETALAALLPLGTTFQHHNKGNASAVASAEQLSALVAGADAVVAAYGH